MQRYSELGDEIDTVFFKRIIEMANRHMKKNPQTSYLLEKYK